MIEDKNRKFFRLIVEGDTGIRRERKRRRTSEVAQKELFKFLGCKSTSLHDCFDLRVALFASVKICYCQGWSVVNGTVMGTVARAVMSTSGHCYKKKLQLLNLQL